MIRYRVICLLRVLVAVWLVGLFSVTGWAEQAISPVSFNLDVIPILSKAGCSRQTYDNDPIGLCGTVRTRRIVCFILYSVAAAIERATA